MIRVRLRPIVDQFEARRGASAFICQLIPHLYMINERRPFSHMEIKLKGTPAQWKLLSQRWMRVTPVWDKSGPPIGPICWRTFMLLKMIWVMCSYRSRNLVNKRNKANGPIGESSIWLFVNLTSPEFIKGIFAPSSRPVYWWWYIECVVV